MQDLIKIIGLIIGFVLLFVVPAFGSIFLLGMLILLIGAGLAFLIGLLFK
jgi:hypothetical protein